MFKKFLFMAVAATGICVACVSAVEPATALMEAKSCLPDISAAGEYCTLALAAVAIPVYSLEDLKAVTKAEFSALQAKYGKLYILDVAIDDDETYQFILRRPTRQHLEMIESFKNDTEKVNDAIIKNLVVAGDISRLDDGIVYARFMAETAQIISQGNAFLSRA
ncbi:MAG: hypothetical protein LBL04_11350 [Bacteroidales bacterium]|nr:hypothetical protein [Bacteroidales bacterium]